ncbi:AAA family ATPase [Parvularcula oceani]|uniref:AAA family ATPase n=1 Tax=Parvularcula oceani TaxID=1247963 RepID=UPI000AE21375|nr:MoxR family ATPase [Parvularcula oceani]
MERFDRLAAAAGRARTALGEHVFGQERVIEEVLIALLAGGHGLLVGTPGLAKTRLVAATATVLGLSERRVQFTPDLMPSDILGAEVLEETGSGKRAFRFIAGPIFCQLLMADEINRASPRTQSALLEAMQERQVTVAGERRVLPEPFHVLATQNPIEQEGTYPLPEAQLDRFLLQIDVDYPDLDAERRMLAATTGKPEDELKAVMGAADLEDAQALVRDLPIGERVVDSILALVRDARPGGAFADRLSWGPGPRASQALSLAVRARALLHGRTAPEMEDVAALAAPVLRHRLALTFAARAEGHTVPGVIEEMTARLG